MNTVDQRTNIRTIFASNIGFLMQEAGISRKKVCSDLGVKYTTFCDWINGRTIPREDQLIKLGDYFGMKPGDLLVEMNTGSMPEQRGRAAAYARASRRLPMDLITTLDDDRIRELIRSGFLFEHRSLEDYIREAGGKNIASQEADWGEPTGSEVW